MAIDKAEVQRIARLAHLEHPKGDPQQLIDDAQLEQLASELSKILGYMAELNQLDTREVPPSSHGLPLPTSFRDDLPTEPADPDRLLAAAPERSGDAIVVPKVVE